MDNLYETLGVSNKATIEEIKKAYKRLTLEHHPDKNGQSKESEELFKKIVAAYKILSDENKRKEYDRELEHESSATYQQANNYYRSTSKIVSPSFNDLVAPILLMIAALLAIMFTVNMLKSQSSKS